MRSYQWWIASFPWFFAFLPLFSFSAFRWLAISFFFSCLLLSFPPPVLFAMAAAAAAFLSSSVNSFTSPAFLASSSAFLAAAFFAFSFFFWFFELFAPATDYSYFLSSFLDSSVAGVLPPRRASNSASSSAFNCFLDFYFT